MGVWYNKIYIAVPQTQNTVQKTERSARIFHACVYVYIDLGDATEEHQSLSEMAVCVCTVDKAGFQ